MRKRNCRFEVRLTKEELSALNKKAKKAGLSAGAFVRRSINGQTVKEAPPVDLPMLIREVRRVGSNIDQLLVIARARGLVDVPELRKALEQNRRVEKHILCAYTEPES